MLDVVMVWSGGSVIFLLRHVSAAPVNRSCFAMERQQYKIKIKIRTEFFSFVRAVDIGWSGAQRKGLRRLIKNLLKGPMKMLMICL